MTALESLGWWLLSMVVIVGASIERPTRAHCPSGWWLAEGVRDDGRFACVQDVPEQLERTPRGGWRDVSPQPVGELRSRVYCTGGSRPVTVHGIDVGCQPGGWQ